MNKRTVYDFTNNEYKQWAQNKNFQNIASVISGLNFSANKVIYTLYKKNIKTFQKVENIANITAAETEYPGGSKNLEGVIYSNIMDYVTGINLPVIEGKGDTGKRLNTLPAAARYNFTRIHENFFKLINEKDLDVVPQYYYEGKYIEYQFIPFTLPMLLINGNEGIGSGHAQKILPRDPISIIKALKAELNNKPLNIEWFKPYFKGFKGTIEYTSEDKQVSVKGIINRKSKTQTEIVEVSSNYSYKKFIATLYDLVEKGKIKSYEDLCDTRQDTFNSIIKHADWSDKTDDEILDILGISTTVTENFTVIDETNRVKVFESSIELFKHFFKIKLEYIQKRLEHQINELKYDLKVNTSKAFFIMSVIKGDIILMNKKKDEVLEQIKTFDKIIEIDGNYNYVLSMPIYNLTQEKFNELKEKIKSIKEEIKDLESKNPKDVWLLEIDELEKYLKKNGY